MVHQIQPVHLLDADDHDPEVLPCNGVVEIGDILAQFEVWIVGVLGDGVPWGWVFERACGFFFFCVSYVWRTCNQGEKENRCY